MLIFGIRAFDDGFIHRNVFIGRQFNRDTKENFSTFILGEQGVKQVKAIAEKKQLRNTASRTRNQLIKSSFKALAIDLESFLKLSPSGTIEESDKKIQVLLTQHADIAKQQKQINAIQARKVGTALAWIARFSDGLKELNQTLKMGLEGIHQEAKATVSKHIMPPLRNLRGPKTGLGRVSGRTKELCANFAAKN